MLEGAGVVLGLAYVVLAAFGKRAFWIFWILAALVYVFVFLQARLYASMVLQLYFVGSGVYGWWAWSSRPGEEEDYRFLSGKSRLLVGMFVIGFGLLLAFLLSRYSDSPAPVFDSISFSLSVAGSYLMARRKIENWFIWMIVNVLYIWLLFSQNLWASSLLYLAYLLLSVWGYFLWKHEMKSIVRLPKAGTP